MHVARKRQNYEVQGAIKIAIYTFSRCKLIHSKSCRAAQSFLEGGKGGGGGLKEGESRVVVFLKSRRKKTLKSRTAPNICLLLQQLSKFYFSFFMTTGAEVSDFIHFYFLSFNPFRVKLVPFIN